MDYHNVYIMGTTITTKARHIKNIEYALGNHINEIVGYNAAESDPTIDDDVTVADSIRELLLDTLLDADVNSEQRLNVEIPDGMDDEFEAILESIHTSPQLDSEIRESCYVVYIILTESPEPRTESRNRVSA